MTMMSQEILLQRIIDVLGGMDAITSGGVVPGGGIVVVVNDSVAVSNLSFAPLGAHSDGATISSATTLTPPTGATKIMIQALTQNVRFTLDGTAPTASKGFQLKSGDPAMIISIDSTTVLKVIQEAATADLQYQWGA